MTRRLVLTGSESTGKTTLARSLAAHFDAPLAGEFVRAFALGKGAPIDAGDHWSIARGQMREQDDAVAQAIATGRPLVVCDTDLLSTVVYARHYTGQCDTGIEQLARERRAHHYLLLEIDVPWVPDGIRDRASRRHEMQALFRDTLDEFGAPYTLVSGSWDERFAAAIRLIGHTLLHP